MSLRFFPPLTPRDDDDNFKKATEEVRHVGRWICSDLVLSVEPGDLMTEERKGQISFLFKETFHFSISKKKLHNLARTFLWAE